MSEEALEELAGKLTEAQRELVLMAWPGSHVPAYALRSDHDGRKAAKDIRECGLFEKVDMSRFGSQVYWYRLNETGLALKAHLTQRSIDHG